MTEVYQVQRRRAARDLENLVSTGMPNSTIIQLLCLHTLGLGWMLERGQVPSVFAAVYRRSRVSRSALSEWAKSAFCHGGVACVRRRCPCHVGERVARHDVRGAPRLSPEGRCRMYPLRQVCGVSEQVETSSQLEKNEGQ